MPHHSETYSKAARSTSTRSFGDPPSLLERDWDLHNLHPVGHSHHKHVRGEMLPSNVQFVDDLGKGLSSDSAERASYVRESDPSPVLYVKELHLDHLCEE